MGMERLIEKEVSRFSSMRTIMGSGVRFLTRIMYSTSELRATSLGVSFSTINTDELACPDG